MHRHELADLLEKEKLGNAIRALRHFGPPDNPRAVSGMDFVVLNGDEIQRLYAFVAG